MNNAPTKSAVELVRDNFNFTVDKFPLQALDAFATIDDDGNPIAETIETGYFGLIRSDTRAIVGGSSVSGRYTPHQTDDICTLVEAASMAFENPQVQCSFNNGHIVNLIPSNDHRRAIYGTNDNIFPRLIISGGYSGQAFKATLGLYRDACTNLQMMRSMESTTVSIRHGSGIQDKVAEYAGTFRNLAAKWSGVVEVMETMEATRCDFADFLEAVYPIKDDEKQRGATIRKNRTKLIFDRLDDEREKTGRTARAHKNYEVSVYEAFNAIQGYSQHDQNRHGSPSLFDKALIAANDPGVKRAENLAFDLIAV